jgi:phosphate-selective porin OprO/OprP
MDRAGRRKFRRGRNSAVDTSSWIGEAAGRVGPHRKLSGRTGSGVARVVAALTLLSGASASANPPAPTKKPGPPPAPSPLAPAGEAAAMAERPMGRATYKPGGGVTLKSQDDRFAISVMMWAQTLLTVRRDQMSPTGAPLATTSLELRRARLVLWGHMFTPHLKYYAHLMFAPKDLGFKDGVPMRAPIFQWYTAVTRLKHAHVQAGFFFVPYARQRMQPLPRLQFADNSTASYEFTLDQDIGVQVSSPDIAGLGMLRYYAGVFMGEGYDWHRASDFGLTYMGRVEVLPLGMFEDFSEADFERPMKPKLSVGAAYAFSDRDRRTRSIAGTAFADGGSMSAHNLTADLMFKWAGLSVLADVYWRRGWRKTGGLLDAEGVPIAVQAARNGFGWTAQMGLFVPRTRFEAVARTAGVRPPRSLATSLARLDEVGGGLNYYFYRHALKLQLDYIHTWGPALPTGRGDQLRLQLQFIF